MLFSTYFVFFGANVCDHVGETWLCDGGASLCVSSSGLVSICDKAVRFLFGFCNICAESDAIMMASSA